MAYEYDLLTVEIDEYLARVIISNPPSNLMTPDLYSELRKVCIELENDDSLSVVLFKSANPDFFIAHFDVEAILQFPTDDEPRRETELNPFHQMCERVRTMDKVTIAQIEGRVGGGGSEFVSYGYALWGLGQDCRKSNGSANRYSARGVGYATVAPSNGYWKGLRGYFRRRGS